MTAIWKRKRTEDLSKLKADKELARLSDNVLQVLASRGFRDAQSAKAVLYGELSDLHDPSLLKDADKAVKYLMQWIKEGRVFLVYGDYDADGVTSATIMTSLLRGAGARVDYWANDRFAHGYTITPDSIDAMLLKHPETEVIVTVDNGISGHAGIAHAMKLGLEVIITDHHDVGETIPECVAVVNPHQKDCPYPFKGLCGASVAFKLMHLLYFRMGLPIEHVYDTLDLVALGTVADVMPQLDENRIMIRKGFEKAMRGDRKAFSILREVLAPKTIDARSVFGFSYGPAINSIGRLDGDPSIAIELFLTDDETRMKEIATYLKTRNEDRSALTRELCEVAIEMVEKVGVKHMNVVYSPDFHEGLTGLIASRLKERYNRPFFVFTDAKGNTLKGSGRGIEGFHLKRAMDKCPETLVGYGGHAKAAGASTTLALIDSFAEKMNKFAEEELTEEDFQKVITVEIPLTPEGLTLDFIEDLRVLEPFGEAFPPPVIGLMAFQVRSEFRMGSEKQHAKLKGDSLDVIIWNDGNLYDELGRPAVIKAIGNPDINDYMGKRSVQFKADAENVRSAG